MKTLKNLLLVFILGLIPIQGLCMDYISPLMQASIEGNLEEVKSLIRNGADINAKDKYGDTALMGASREGNLEVVKFLVQKGANINVKNEDGNTALMEALGEGNLEVVQYLKSKGAKE